MAPSLPIVAALLSVSRGEVDEGSLLQMPMVDLALQADGDQAECRCPGYFREQCEAEAAQGCVWSDAGSSNKPWCQCLNDPVGPPATAPPPPPVTHPPPPVTEPPAPVTAPPAPVTEPPAPVTAPPAPVTEPPAPVTEPPAPVTEPPAPVSPHVIFDEAHSLLSVSPGTLSGEGQLGWRRPANSNRQISADDSICGISFKCNTAATHAMIGLSHQQVGNWPDFDYGVTCRGAWAAYTDIYEDGGNRHREGGRAGNGNPTTDVHAIFINAEGEVEYSINGGVYYTSSQIVQYPWHVAVDSYTAPELVDVEYVECGVAPPIVTPPPPVITPWDPDDTLVVFDNVDDALTTVPGTLSGEGQLGWSTPANSDREVSEYDSICGITFKCDTPEAHLMIGLAHQQVGVWRDFDYGITCRGEWADLTDIYENGANRYREGSRPTNGNPTTDIHGIRINEVGQVEYSVNGVVYYTSEREVTYPWHVAVDSYTAPSLVDVEYIQCGVELPIVTPVVTPWDPDDTLVVFDNFDPDLTVSPGQLSGEGQLGWRTPANSNRDIVSSDDSICGVSFKCSSEATHAMIGLASRHVTNWPDFDYGVTCRGAWAAFTDIYENGNNRYREGGRAGNGNPEFDVHAIFVNEDGEVEYSINGAVYYTSERQVSYPFHVAVDSYTAPELLDVEYVQCGVAPPVVTPPPPVCDPFPDDTLVVFDHFDPDLTASPGSLSGAGQLSWRTPANSAHEVTACDEICGVSFKCSTAATHAMIGLSHRQVANWPDFDYGITCRGAWAAFTDIYENGGNRHREGGRPANGNPTTDVHAVFVNEDGQVEYSINGNVYYTSSREVTYPFHVAVDSYTAPELLDVEYIQCGVPPPVVTPPPPVCDPFDADDTLVVFDNADADLTVSPGTLSGAGQLSWRTPANSAHEVTACDEICGVSFKCSTAATHAMIGIAHQQVGNWPDFDYGVTCRGAWAAYTDIYENGNNRYREGGRAGNGNAAQDVHAVFINGNGQVEYSINGEIYYTSTRDVTYPWHVAVDSYTAPDLVDVEYIQCGVPPVAPPPPPCDEFDPANNLVVFDNFNPALTVSPGTLSGAGQLSWRKPANSHHQVVSADCDSICGVSFKCNTAATHAMIGIAHQVVGNWPDFDYGVTCRGAWAAYTDIYENGHNRHREGGRPANGNPTTDVHAVFVNEDGQVEYSINGNVYYTSAREVTYPWHVAVDSYTAPELVDVEYIQCGVAPPVVTPPPPVCAQFDPDDTTVVFDNAHSSLTVSPGTLSAHGQMSWRKPANSAREVECVTDDSVCGISFKCNTAVSHLMIGLAHQEVGNWPDFDYGVTCRGAWAAYTDIYENGGNRHRLAGRAANGNPNTDQHAIFINADGQVEYSLNGAVYYTSSRAVSYPWHVAVDTYTSPSLIDVEYIQCGVPPVAPPPPPVIPWDPANALVVFDNSDSALTVSPGSLTGAGQLSWRTPANSNRDISQNAQICGFSFKCNTAATHAMIGIAHQQVGNWPDFDYGVTCRGAWAAYTDIYENGSNRHRQGGRAGNGNPTTDVHAVFINSGGQVEYSINGAVYYTSSRAVTYPWHAAVDSYTAPNLAEVQYLQCS